jgi:proteic killer suppression protein
MIQSFKCADTLSLYEGHGARRFGAIRPIAERKLQMLDSAASLDALRAPPGNRLEALKGDRAGQYSIRINSRGAFVLPGHRTAPRPSRLWTITEEELP